MLPENSVKPPPLGELNVTVCHSWQSEDVANKATKVHIEKSKRILITINCRALTSLTMYCYMKFVVK